jgi:hypothetical protein
LSFACDNDSLLTLGAAEAEPEPAPEGSDCRTVVSLSPTDVGVAGVFDEAGADLGLSVSGAGEGDGGLVTPGVALDLGEAIGLVAEVAADRGAGDTAGIEPPEPWAEPPEPDEPDDFALSLAESGDPDELPVESLPLRPELPFCSLPVLPSVSACESGAFGSGFFRTTVSG